MKPRRGLGCVELSKMISSGGGNGFSTRGETREISMTARLLFWLGTLLIVIGSLMFAGIILGSLAMRLPS